MSNIAIRKRRRTTNNWSSIVIPKGEVVVDIDKPTLIVGNGSTPGGIPLAQSTHSHPNATTNTSGFMSATDKTKLDAISESGAITSIQSNGTNVTPARSKLNFSTDFTLTDDNVNERTNIVISNALKSTLLNDALMLALILG
jgi:hypothetical protein